MVDRRLADLSTTDVRRVVSDPSIGVGGGSVAALTGVTAAGAALLVMRLNARRRSLADKHDAIEACIAEVEQIADALEQAADDDVKVLETLLTAHQQRRSSGDPGVYVDALHLGASSTLAVAELLVELLERVESQLDVSSRFTVSDLGAAATLAEGACRAALLTAEVNVALLGEESNPSNSEVQSLDTRCQSLRARCVELGESIETRTRRRLRGEKEHA